jgi:outer membrane receptor protein involved in Fe transport
MMYGAATAAIATSSVAFSQEEEEEKVEKIAVTGSRIARTGIDTIRPTIGVDAEILEKNAFTNIADALAEVPTFGPGITPNGGQNAFSVGSNFVDLFDLGTQRTLTLVNGRRFVSSNVPSNFGSAGGLQVDLNAIPVALLRTVEVVPLAGAAVYGSDAVAGVVNVVLKDDYEGFELSAQYGTSEDGDANTRQIQAVVGGNFDDGRGNAVFAIELNRQDGLLLTERPLFVGNPEFRISESSDVNGDGLDDAVNNIIFGGRRLQSLSTGGAVTPAGLPIPSLGVGQFADGNSYQFAPNGDLVACQPGETDPESVIFANGGTCGDDFFDIVSQIRSPVERVVATILSHYDITDNIRFSQEFLFSNNEAVELVNQGAFNGIFGGDSGALTFSADHALLNEQARSVLAANNLDQFTVNRFNNDLLNGGADETENLTFRYFGGFEGDFDLAGRNFTWDIGAVFGRAEVETRGSGIVDGRFVNALDAVELNEETLQPIIDIVTENGTDLTGDGVVDTADALAFFNVNGGSGLAGASLGDVVCQTNINNAAGTLTGANSPVQGSGINDTDLPFTTGCVPLNIFGEGAPSAAALDFITGGPQLSNSDIEQRVITANIGTELVELPAGAWAVAVGYETRTETARFSPGLDAAVPFTRSAPIVGISGQLETQEYYAETFIPITNSKQGIPFAHIAEINASYRSVENTVTAPDGSETSNTDDAFEVGFRWAPVEDVVIRGTYAEAIRTPSLVELFTPTTQSFVSGDDPCDSRFVNAGPNPDVRRANCIAAGISDPDNFTSLIVGQTVQGFDQGNPALTPEKSESFSIGAVFEPRWVDNLVVTLDYFSIDISERIETFEFEDLAEQCFDSLNFPNEAACATFTRDVNGQVINPLELRLNAANSEFSALQYRLTYDFDIADALGLFNDNWGKSDYGNFDVSINLLRRIKDQEQLTAGADVTRDVGDFADPRLSGTFDFTWTKGPYRAFWRINYQDGAEFDVNGDEFFRDVNGNIITKTDARYIHNASFQYQITEGTSVQLSANNLFSRNPDLNELAFGFFNFQEQIGTTYSLRVRTQF